MLQQTTVATVIPYFERFLEHFPTVHHLAGATEEEVFHLWQGLGYYNRARNLMKCAKVVSEKYEGTFPKTEEELLSLPGIGPYTAAAISAIAYDAPSTVVDGNIERIISRLYRISTPLPKSKPEIKEKAAVLTPFKNNGDYAQALMDLGATVCTPKQPKCEHCPIHTYCEGFKKGDMENYPQKEKKKPKPTFKTTAYILKNAKGEVYLQKRPSSGLLASLWELPNEGIKTEVLAPLPYKVSDGKTTGNITHVFTHFKLEMEIKTAKAPKELESKFFFKKEALPPLPTLFRKALKAADFL